MYTYEVIGHGRARIYQGETWLFDIYTEFDIDEVAKDVCEALSRR